MPFSTGFLATSAALLLAAIYATASNVHDELQNNGLPPGLLPDSVVSYSVGDNGEFEVELSSPCYVHFSDLVYYEKKIRGKLSYGAIADLEGIKVKKHFIWFPITGIVADPRGKALVFQASFLSELFPAAQFEKIPHCKAKPSCHGSGGFVAEGTLPISEA